MDALVTDVDGRTAVAGLRALGRCGLEVMAQARTRAAAGLWSRYAAGRVTGPSPVTDPAGFVATVSRVARDHGPLVVYAPLEEGLEALLAAAGELPPQVVLPYEDPKAVQALRDKRALAALAAGAGLAAPSTLAEGTPSELLEVPIATPCVLKAAYPERGLNFTLVVETRDELLRVLRDLPDNEPLLVQERARGRLVGLTLVTAPDGRLLSWFQQESRRTWPPQAGGSTLAVSVAPDTELVSRSAGLLRDAGYWGLAQLQFLETRQGLGVIDVNPRFYGSMPLALAAGVNPAAAWHAAIVGDSLPAPVPYRIGVAYRWLEGELTAAMRGSPRLLLERYPRPRAGAMWSPEDPVPSAILGARAAGLRVRKRLPRLRTA